MNGDHKPGAELTDTLPPLELAAQALWFRPYSHALYPALADDPFYRTLEAQVADPAMAREAMLTYYDYSALEAVQFGTLCTLEDEAGIAIWSRPLTPQQAALKSDAKARVLAALMGPQVLDAYSKINSFMSDAAGALVDPSDWYLSILGVSPRLQGQGRGAALIRSTLDQADAAGVATFLETFTPRNMPFYERLGYSVAGAFDEPVTGSRYWLMRREAPT